MIFADVQSDRSVQLVDPPVKSKVLVVFAVYAGSRASGGSRSS